MDTCPHCAKPLYADPARIRDARRAAGVGLRETARRVGISPSYLCDLEAGLRHLSFEMESRILTALGKALNDAD
jgi:transcriptional regulator with XRE-family HTH domain